MSVICGFTGWITVGFKFCKVSQVYNQCNEIKRETHHLLREEVILLASRDAMKGMLILLQSYRRIMGM